MGKEPTTGKVRAEDAGKNPTAGGPLSVERLDERLKQHARRQGQAEDAIDLTTAGETIAALAAYMAPPLVRREEVQLPFPADMGRHVVNFLFWHGATLPAPQFEAMLREYHGKEVHSGEPVEAFVKRVTAHNMAYRESVARTRAAGEAAATIAGTAWETLGIDPGAPEGGAV